MGLDSTPANGTSNDGHGRDQAEAEGGVGKLKTKTLTLTHTHTEKEMLNMEHDTAKDQKRVSRSIERAHSKPKKVHRFSSTK